MQFAYHDRTPIRTTNGVGIAENGFAMSTGCHDAVVDAASDLDVSV